DRARYEAENCKGLHGRISALGGLGPESDESLSGCCAVPEPIPDGSAVVASGLHGLGLVVIRLQLVAGELQCFTIGQSLLEGRGWRIREPRGDVVCNTVDAQACHAKRRTAAVAHSKVMPCLELGDFGDELIRQCPRRRTARKAHRTDKSF